MQQWEYLLLWGTKRDDGSAAGWQDSTGTAWPVPSSTLMGVFGALGAAGWELVAVDRVPQFERPPDMRGPYFYFKRARPADA